MALIAFCVNLRTLSTRTYLYRIEIFNAASNDLTSLPSDIVKMTGLKNIDVSDNLLEALPEGICKLPMLTSVNCADTKIRQIGQI
jgi:Leucine-rich repeat (LRR) protein